MLMKWRPAMINKLYRLTESQKRIWYTQLIYEDLSMYNIGGTVTINGKVNLEYLRCAIEEVISQNDAFSIRLVMMQNEVYQYFVPYSRRHNIEFKDFSYIPNEFDNWVKQVIKKEFEPTNNQLYYCCLFKLDENTYGYLIKAHHIIFDGWSMQLFCNEVKRVYESLCSKTELVKKEKYQFVDYIKEEAEYLNSDKYLKDKHFWLYELGYEVDNKQCYMKKAENIEGSRKSFICNQNVTSFIKEFCEKNKISINTFFIGIYGIYEYLKYGNSQISLCNPLLGRVGRRQKECMGMFVNIIPVQINIFGEETFLEYLKRIGVLLGKMYKHQKYPYNHFQTVNKFKFENNRQICINYYNSKICEEINSWDVTNTECYSEKQEYALQIIIREWVENTIQLDFDYRLDLFSGCTIDDMYLEMIHIVKQIEKDIIIKNIISVHSVDNKKQDKSALFRNSEISDSWTVVDWIKKAAMMYPNSVAISFKEIYISYNEFLTKANTIAGVLVDRGLKPQQIVGVVSNCSLETVVCMIGILMAGGVYLPISDDMPLSRIQYILKDSNVSYLFCEKSFFEKLSNIYCGCLFDINGKYQSKNYEVKISPSFAAYIIYTSGSTGNPKGVIIEHRNFLNYLIWARKIYQITDSDIFPFFTSISFDLTLTSIFLPLICGASIRVYNKRLIMDRHVLQEIIFENVITVMKMTPSHLLLLSEYNLERVRLQKLIIGGENLAANIAEKVWTNTGGKILLYNEYGPTEATIGCMVYLYQPGVDINGNVPIGQAMEEGRIYLLDENRKPVLNGEIGEIYIAGKNVARGYLNNQFLTSKNFILDIMYPDDIMYKTGDYGKIVDERGIEFIGRKDNQVKVNGYRIELGEIEACINDFQGILKSAIVCDNRHVLNCYYVSDVLVNENRLQEFLISKLPDYMVPRNYYRLKTMPLTINGKIDYGVLAKILPSDELIIDDNKMINESDRKTRQILSVCASVLRQKEIMAEQNYYVLGGDSIKAIEISSLCKEIGYDLKVKDILNYPIFGDFIARAQNENAIKKYKNSKGLIHQTPMIKWFVSRKFSDRNLYYQNVILNLYDSVDISDLAQGLNYLVNYHEMLHAMFCRTDNSLYVPEKYEFTEIKYFDCRKRGKFDNDLIADICHNLSKSFDIYNGKMLQAALCNTQDGNALILMIHHLVVDTVSWRIILDDLDTIIEQMKKNKNWILPNKTQSYQDWAEQFDKLTLLKYENMSDINYTRWDEASISLDFDLTASLLLRKYNALDIKPIEIMIIALYLTMCQFHTKVCYEIEKHGRDIGNFDVTRSVGWFTQMIEINVMSEDVNNLSLNELIELVKETYRTMHMDKTFVTDSDSCCKVRFNYLGDFKTQYNNFTMLPMPFKQNELTCDIEINGMVINERLRFTCCNANGEAYSILDSYSKNLSRIISYCIDCDEQLFILPNDEGVSLSSDELSSIFF